MIGLKDFLFDCAGQVGVTLSDGQLEQFILYMDMLKEWNERLNLTAITDDREIIQKHFADSLSVLPYMPSIEKSTFIDVGTGAGFPGLPVAIACGGCDATLLDSLNKRLVFVNEVIAELKLDRVKTIHSRAEDGARSVLLRERFDYVCARAVKNLSVLAEYCLPYVETGGLFIAMKGGSDSVKDEIGEAKNALKLLGGEITEVVNVKIPHSDINHSLIMIKKYRQTPAKFPRSYAKIAKEPIK